MRLCDSVVGWITILPMALTWDLAVTSLRSTMRNKIALAAAWGLPGTGLSQRQSHIIFNCRTTVGPNGSKWFAQNGMLRPFPPSRVDKNGGGGGPGAYSAVIFAKEHTMLDKFSHTDSYILIGATLCAQKISKIDPPSPWTFSSKIESPGFDRIVWRHHNFKMCLTLEPIYYVRRDHPRSRQQWLIGLPFWDDDFDPLILFVIRWSKMMRLCLTICLVPGNPHSHAHGSLIQHTLWSKLLLCYKSQDKIS